MAKKAAKKSAKSGKRPAAKRQLQTQKQQTEPKVVVFFELSGVAGVRFHGEFSEVDRARLAARALVSSPDVAQAWLFKDLEIIRKPGA